ncbi:RNA polymerase sigma factor [Isosphaeraceae bacterium EP7]
MSLKSDLDTVQERLLVVAATNLDQDAFLRLIEIYERRISYYIRRLIGDDDEWTDILQEVWLQAYRRIVSLRVAEAFRVWLYRIAHDQAMTYLRRHRLQERVAAECAADSPALHGWDEREALENAELVHHILGRLSLPHREVLTLRFLEDLSLNDIAEVVGERLGTIKSRLHYAKAELRREMEAICHE